MKLTTATGDGSTLLTIRLWRDEPTGESDASILREQLDAMRSFTEGWIEPLAVALDVVCCDPAQGYSSYSVPPPPIRAWFTHTRAPGVAMEARQIGSHVDERDTLDADRIELLVQRALDQRCSDDHVTGIETLSWEAMRVKLPSTGVTTFVVEDVDLEIPVERREDGEWVSGPRIEALTGSPFWLSLNEGQLRFDVHWAAWLDTPGRAQVDAAVERVLARQTGWYRAP